MSEDALRKKLLRCQQRIALLEGAIEERARSLYLAKEQAERNAKDQRRILSAVHAFFIELDEKGVVRQWTPAAERILGISVLDAIGQSFDSLSIVWEWDKIACEISQVRGSMKETVVDKLRITMPDGTQRFLKLSILPVFSDEGLSVVLMGEDQTEWLRMEHELAHGQKLESIGQLAAGIAHEINTPTQFIGDNVRFVSESLEGCLGMLNRYTRLLALAKRGEVTHEVIGEHERAIHDADLDYVLAEMPKALAQAGEGIERIATIVRAMKEFAHPDTGEKTAVDLNKALDSTITVARNEWKYVADMMTDFDSGLPPVRCLPGEINQVILNLIVNAAHAIGDVVKQTGGKGMIAVSTRRAGEWVEIRVADTGTGIPDAVRDRIFDPFFTTKEVGKGTGQGLSIARTVVVEKHDGTLTFESQAGRGTTFLVRLPIGSSIAESAGSQRSRSASDQAAVAPT